MAKRLKCTFKGHADFKIFWKGKYSGTPEKSVVKLNLYKNFINSNFTELNAFEKNSDEFLCVHTHTHTQVYTHIYVCKHNYAPKYHSGHTPSMFSEQE